MMKAARKQVNLFKIEGTKGKENILDMAQRHVILVKVEKEIMVAACEQRNDISVKFKHNY